MCIWWQVQGLTFKIGNVKRMSPASKAGLSKMDYLISVITDITMKMTQINICYISFGL